MKRKREKEKEKIRTLVKFVKKKKIKKRFNVIENRLIEVVLKGK